jgi:hypothetical protein
MFRTVADSPHFDPTTGHTERKTRSLAGMYAVLAALCAAVCLLAASSASAQSTTYSATQTIPVPPASDFASPGGGDGWAVALSSTQAFNVFHHQSTLNVACHEQSDGSNCWSPERITDSSGNDFATQGLPGLYLDQSTGKLYVYATRSSDSTAGVVCIDTTQAATNTNPFCGYTPLTPAGDGPLDPSGISGVGNPVQIGSRWYAFNYVNGAGQTGAQNALLCFDLATDAACSGQPFAVNIGSGDMSYGGFPAPAEAAIGHQLVMAATVGGSNELMCFDDTTKGACSGGWPVALSFSYPTQDGAPFPMLNANGGLVGLCLPTGTDQCYGLDGSSQTTPTGMSGVIEGNSPWNGPAFVLGPRVYVPDGNANGEIGQVECFDYSTNASCTNFPKAFTSGDLEYLYTVNPDPQRPTCIWVNADGGTHQIQNFDAYTGGPCGQGDVRVLASQFVVPQQSCFPTSYNSLQVLSPDRSTYTTGTLSFQDGDANPIAGASDLSLDGTGSASLVGLNLNSATGLPQFLIHLDGESGTPGQVVVKLTWTATYDPSCVGPGISATAPVSPPLGAAPTPPGDISPPAISGQPLPGDKLTCSTGKWSGNPSSYSYTWSVDGKVIKGATGRTYTVQIANEGHTITCSVSARNGAGASRAVSSKGVVVGYKNALTCPKPSGAVGGTKVGMFTIGLTRTGARKKLHRYQVTHNGFDNFCLYAGWGIRLGYPSKALLGKLTKSQAKGLKGHVVLALTANPFYALIGARPGMKLSAVAKRLHVSKPFHVGTNDWYFVPGKNARGVLKVRGGVIQEIGLANLALTAGREQQRRFINSFQDG